MKTMHFCIRGTVQGVGFRPFIYLLAHELSLKGWIQNTPEGVDIELEGSPKLLDSFMGRLHQELPTHCVIDQLIPKEIPFKDFKDFKILSSESFGEQNALVLPDISTCDQCLVEILDSNNRRYLYPFTNCTHCGPRYSILENLPYDRQNTSMKYFKMCPLCQNEYDDPLDRRFHAQPNACPVCGPWVELWDSQGKILHSRQEALEKTAQYLQQGKIVAVKGLGGFHLMVNAGNHQSVRLLRQRKNRPEKPLAVMFPSLKDIVDVCHTNEIERTMLISSEAPIVLLRKKKKDTSIDPLVAPDNPYIGSMLPCMPLQHILLRLFAGPLVATSANIGDEPICIDNLEAVHRLSGIADYFLVHNRPIVRQVDDSLLQEVAEGPYFLRRSRGFAPLPIKLETLTPGVLAVGAHQKNTVALSTEQGAIVSQHIGDLDTLESMDTFKKTIDTLHQIYPSTIKEVVCDMHPDYNSSSYAKGLKIDIKEVQHHHAHVASCMAEYSIKEVVLGICFDGTGFGLDHTIWGGEFLICEGTQVKRIGHLKPFPLPGGEIAVREPRRSALGLLYALEGDRIGEFANLEIFKTFSNQELELVKQMLDQKINSPLTSSMGRFFDGVSSLVNLCHKASFEGQAAMALEFEVRGSFPKSYFYEIIKKNDVFIVDWSKIVLDVIEDIRCAMALGIIAAKFHNTLTEIIVDMAHRVGQNKVILTGGCFQNKVLVESAIDRLKHEGFTPLWHTKVPPNDGGIALGQLYIAAGQGVKQCV